MLGRQYNRMFTELLDINIMIFIEQMYELTHLLSEKEKLGVIKCMRERYPEIPWNIQYLDMFGGMNEAFIRKYGHQTVIVYCDFDFVSDHIIHITDLFDFISEITSLFSIDELLPLLGKLKFTGMSSSLIPKFQILQGS